MTSKNMSIEGVFKGVASLLLTIVAAMVVWMIGRIDAIDERQDKHAERITKVEADQSGTRELLLEIRTDIRELRKLGERK